MYNPNKVYVNLEITQYTVVDSLSKKNKDLDEKA